MVEVLLFIVGLLIGAGILFIVSQKKVTQLVKDRNRLFSEVAVRNSEVGLLRTQMADERQRMEEMQQKSDEQFAQRLSLVQEQLKNTTEILLRQRSEELDKTNMAQMGAILTPLREVIKEMKDSMDDNKESFARSTSALGEQLRQMMTVTNSLGSEAEKLSKALQTGPKVQGDFGEMKLRDLLDKFGFSVGLEYDVQYVMRDAKGKVIRNDDTNDSMRPDVVLHYPEEKDVIIDAKASLTAFIGYVNATTDEERSRYLEDHVKSVRKHINELADKQYYRYNMDGRQTLDFVIMFIPNEAAMQAALYKDPDLWSYAFNKKVFVTSEQNLYAVLRMLEIAWIQRRQTENQEKVFGLANLMIDRVGDFIERFEDIGDKVDKLQKSYDSAHTKLTGNQSMLVPARKLVNMGAKENPKHPLPEIDSNNV
ncbi:MAG: DNA recombination protein RmuC [Prevotella sp.]|nr:DNA recombination protein RmuC [Prevotella sp.]MBQ6031955.1 DNA recombination protein RmuC [Prevotella sp.]MBQ6308923.1 DNA recombination protein RmuC [Prevotella sp.]MBQ7441831.1 DNA recombination protein RmuC [Prevotella sp.]MBQ9224150.1 DNA recombination protein RmuC [Prevotella sp.]